MVRTARIDSYGTLGTLHCKVQPPRRRATLHCTHTLHRGRVEQLEHKYTASGACHTHGHCRYGQHAPNVIAREQDSFNAFRQRLSAQLESQDQQQQQEEEEDAGGEQLDSAGAPGQPHRWALRQLLRAAGSAFLRHMPPQDAFRLYCWAAEVVQSCSMEVEVEPEAGTGQQQQRHWAGAAGEVDGGVRPRRLVCIAPVAWCVPKVR